MTASVTLLMAIHCHQPVGNFDSVIENAYAQAYEPFLRALERHPSVRLALHYSGPLLEWLAARHPEFLQRSRVLAQRGQIELLASGYGEPILPLLPEADRQGQIALMRSVLRERFGAEADGLWLTERVWEPDLPATLARAGIRYTMLDVNQFAPAKPWLPAGASLEADGFWDVFGAYTSEAQGASVLVFPSSKRLRYWLPFQPVDRAREFLRGLRRDEPVAITFADDGEKFGHWPNTHRWVHTDGWLESFFGMLERESDWLATSTFREYAARTEPSGRVHLPCGSYDEMLEWSGGFFRNFFVKYPEANAMQQKMLRVSESVRTAGRRRPLLARRAARELYLGQCNCAYWHGVFGGLYLAHLRRGVYRHLIAAEALAHRAAGGRTGVSAVDADGDGRREARITTPAMSVTVDPADGGAVTDWSLFGPRVNLIDTLSRRPEPYHAALLRPRGGSRPDDEERRDTPASIHDRVNVKDAPDTTLRYDDHRRSFFLDYGLRRMPTLDELVQSRWEEDRLWSPGRFEWKPPRRNPRAPRVEMSQELATGRIRKTVAAGGDRQPSLECVCELQGITPPVFGLEFNVGLRDARWLAPRWLPRVSRFEIREPALGVTLRLELDPPAALAHYPIETVSGSEAGLERTYQGLCVVCLWAPGERDPWTSRTRWRVDAAAV